MSTEPKTISFEALKDTLRGFGIEGFEEIKRIEIGPDGMRVERGRRDERGQIIWAGVNAATVTTVIGYTEDQDDNGEAANG